jgi:hypothetical protein
MGSAAQRGSRSVISRAALPARAHEWGLTEEVVEKDHVLG